MADDSDVPPWVLHGVMQAESAGNPNAVGPQTRSGTAKGLMQFTDATAKDEHIDPMDPLQAVDGASHKLKTLYAQQGNWPDALAAYNWGPENVKQHGTGNLPPETRSYVDKIMAGQPQGADAQGAASWLDSIAPAQHANDAAGAGNAASWLDSIAPAGAAPDADDDTPNPANQDSYDRGKVPPVKDSVEEEDRLHDMRPSWLKAGMRMLPGSNYTDQVFTPRGRNAIARGAVKSAAGLPGSIESGMGGDQQESHRNWAGDLVFGKDSPPTDPALLGHGTALPSSSDADHALTTLGWKPDAKHAEGEDIPGYAALGATGLMGAESLARGGGAKVRDLVRGGTPEQLALQGNVARTAAERTIPGQKPMPPELASQPPDVKPNYPGPVGTPGPREAPAPGAAPTPAGERRTMALRDAPGVSAGQPASAHALDDEFETAAGDVKSAVGAEKADVRSTMEWNRMRDQPAPDLKPLSDHISELISKTAGASHRAALQAQKQLEEIIAIDDPVARHEQLDQFKRDLADKGGAEAEGYKAINVKQAGALKEHVDAALKEYEPFAKYAEDYTAASAKGKPFRASFMQQLGADESGSTMLQGAMKSPRNVDIGIKAAGGLEHFDPIAAKHVVGEIADMDSAGLEKWAGKNREILAKLPQARAAFEGVQQRVNMHAAMEGATKKFEEQLAQQTKAHAAEIERANDFTARHVETERGDVAAARKEAEQINALHRTATDAGNAKRMADYDQSLTVHQNAVNRAATYAGDLRELQQAVPKDRAATVERIVRKMNDDGLITPDEHTAFLKTIADAKRTGSKADALSTLSKYVTYALTGNYLVSFGGPALVRAVKAGE